MAPPSKYRPEYCAMLIDYMADGFPFESFGAILWEHTKGTKDEVKAHKQTLYEWAEAHPLFGDAKKMGEVLSYHWWLTEGKKGIWGGKQFNATPWIFNMRNRFHWRDDPKPDTESGKDLNEVVEGLKLAASAANELAATMTLPDTLDSETDDTDDLPLE